MSSSTSHRESPASSIAIIFAYSLAITIIVLEPLVAWFSNYLLSASPPASAPHSKRGALTHKRHSSLGALSSGALLSFSVSSMPRRYFSSADGVMTPLSLLTLSHNLSPPQSLSLAEPHSSPPSASSFSPPPPILTTAPESYQHFQGPARTTQTPLPDQGEPISRKQRRARKKRALAVSH